VLSSGIEDQPPAVVLDVSLYVEEPVDLVLLSCLLRLTALSVLGDIRSAGRAVRWGLRAGGCRSHVLKIDPSSRSP
jgi:hypothetical protein